MLCDDFRLLNPLQKHLVLFLTSEKSMCNPPSHSLECNVVFIICQAYYKKDYKKTRVVAPRNLKPVQGRASLVI